MDSTALRLKAESLWQTPWRRRYPGSAECVGWSRRARGLVEAAGYKAPCDDECGRCFCARLSRRREDQPR